MLEIVLRPQLHKFDSCRGFAQEFALGQGDLIFTNKVIYQPFFAPLGTGADVIFQERYGAGEPTDLMVERIMKDLAERADCKRIIAVGGGSVMDIAKVLAVADGSGSVDALYGKMPALSRRYELVLVPTTCGTGSEMTNIAILDRVRLGSKMGLVSPALYADCAVLIPELLSGLPYHVFAASSIDALVHAVESALSPKATDHTKLYSYEAIRLLIQGYQMIAREGPQACPEVFDPFLTAANYAGIAFGTSGCATVHALSYPLSGKYHVAHGESNYVFFLPTWRMYREHSGKGELDRLERYLARMLQCRAEDVCDELERLLQRILPYRRLRDHGVKRGELEQFAADVLEHQGRLLSNSMIPLDLNSILQLYQRCY